jgi:hypothetical protein
MALADLQTALQQVDTLLVELTANPKPTYSVDGVSYSWESYFAMLCDRREKLEVLIVDAGGPYELISRGVPVG